MSRTIFCTYLQRDAEGQDFQLYPGELGTDFSSTLPNCPRVTAS